MVDFFINLISSHGPLIAYLLLFVSAFVENIFPPIPGDTVTLFGAYLVGRGELDVVPVFSATVAGSFIGFMAIYSLGLKKGRALFDRGNSSLRSAHRLEKVERWFGRYGPKVILANRFLSGLRSLVALAAGIGNMPAGKVTFYSLISIGVWNGFIIYAGLMVGANWPTVKTILSTYSRIIVLLAIGLIAGLLLRFLLKRRERTPQRR
ncbi:MAG: DedA family protein [bacterium]